MNVFLVRKASRFSGFGGYEVVAQTPPTMVGRDVRTPEAVVGRFAFKKNAQEFLKGLNWVVRAYERSKPDIERRLSKGEVNGISFEGPL